MLPRRTGMDQIRALAQQLPKQLRVACDDSSYRRFEFRKRGDSPVQGLDMFREFGPAFEAVHPRNDELRVGQNAHCSPRLGTLEFAAREFRHSFSLTIEWRTTLGRDQRAALQAYKRFNPFRYPRTDAIGVIGPARLDQILCLFLVLFEVRLRWERKGVRWIWIHTKLLSWMPVVRINQAERRFVVFVIPFKRWARPFPRTGSALARYV